MLILQTNYVAVDVVDLLVGAFLLTGLVNAFHAITPSEATRAVGVALSGTVIFWCSRVIAGRGFRGWLWTAVAVTVVVVAITALLEAYGPFAGLSTFHRAPGGTLGNRNRMAHILTLGLPFLVIRSVKAPDSRGVVFGAMGVAAVCAALVLSRSRAAWIALAVATMFFVVIAIWHGQRWPASSTRCIVLLVAGLVGGSVAATAPDQLYWESDTPFTDSIRHLVDFRTGSGHGRVIQYINTLRMVRDHPLLGVGPGSWAAAYSCYATRDDPSYRPDEPIPTNRLPEGDWLAMWAEYGSFGLCFALGAAGLLLDTCMRRSLRGSNVASAQILAAVTVVTAGCLGVFDPLLLTPLGVFTVAVAVGSSAPQRQVVSEHSIAWRGRAILMCTLAGLFALPMRDTVRRFRVEQIYSTPDDAPVRRVVLIDPIDFGVQWMLASAAIRAGRCDVASLHLMAAHKLFPTSPALTRLAAPCANLSHGVSDIAACDEIRTSDYRAGMAMLFGRPYGK